MRALLVMDMQEAMLGKNRNKKNTYKADNLIKSINNEIGKFDKANVIYVKTVNKDNFINKILSKNMTKSSPATALVEKLNVVNREIIEKENKDVFGNKNFENMLKKAKIDELQIVGVDTCGSIFNSVISGLKKGFKVVLNKNLVDTNNKNKATKLYKKMQNKGAKILN